MTTETKKKPKPAKAKALGYGEQVVANRLLKDFFQTTSAENGREARRILDALDSLLESALE
jgi:hypothetical protein